MGHQIAGRLAQVGKLHAFFGGDDEAKLVAVIASPVEEVPTFGDVSTCRVSLSLFAVAGDAIALQIPQIGVDRLGAPTAGVEPSACFPLPGQPVWIAARAADRPVHVGQKSTRRVTHLRSPLGAIPDLDGADMEIAFVAGHAMTIDARSGSIKRRLRGIEAWRAMRSCSGLSREGTVRRATSEH